ncbi:MAG: hypothetical protein MK212_19840, partial [Saprospiraceae bacterium]|nr:hypothetical protein [Saprospiraceae bacterium]
KQVGPNPFVTLDELGGYTMLTAQAAMKRAVRYLEKAIIEGREAIYLANDSYAKDIVVSKAKLSVENYMVGRGNTFYYESVDSEFRHNIDILYKQLEDALESI